jgi:hypothetical protein
VRNALVYVLANFRKHAKARLSPGIDAFSSAVEFDGWRGFRSPALIPRAGPPFERERNRTVGAASPLALLLASCVEVSRPATWLGATGWRRHGLLRIDERPNESS